ncbi:MAG TPA: hypothetical protein VKT51_05045 [Candidatus Eremiobacteraceae bacterium]|nr:hypothetical protein [Candidatus Eremiobacteraceae bacterium]
MAALTDAVPTPDAFIAAVLATERHRRTVCDDATADLVGARALGGVWIFFEDFMMLHVLHGVTPETSVPKSLEFTANTSPV